MSDVQGSASLDTAQVVAGLRQMKTAIDQITGGMTKLNTESERTKRTLKDTFKDSAQAASKAGGPLGSYTGRLLGGASMGDAFGRIAIGLTLATTAARAFSGQVDRAVQESLALLKVQRELREVAEKSNNEMMQQARRGESQAASLTPMVAVGGKTAMEDLEMVTSTGAATQEQAAQGIAAIYGRFGSNPRRASNAVDLAMRGAIGGLDFSEVAKELTEHGAAIDDPAQADRLLGRMAMRQTGARGNPEQIWQSRMRNLSADSFIARAREEAGLRSTLNRQERDALIERSPARLDLSRSNPLANNTLDQFNREQQTIAELTAMSEAARNAVGGLGYLAEMAKNVGVLFGGAGSYQNQLEAFQRQSAEARGIKLGQPKQDVKVYPTGPYIPGYYGPFGR